MSMKKTIELTNNDGHTLRGFISISEQQRFIERPIFVVFANGGLMGCEGDFRVYVRFEKELNSAGYNTFRFSPHGLGLSDGIICTQNLKNLFGKVAKGMFVDDILIAVKYLRNNYPACRIVLSGVCGGAINTYLAATQIEDVAAVIPVSLPLILDGANVDSKNRMSRDYSKLVLSTYRAKILNPHSWLRFFSGKSDKVRVFSALRNMFKIRNSQQAYLKKYQINLAFLDSTVKLLKHNVSTLFIFGKNDRLWWEFKELFYENHINAEIANRLDVYLIENANHMLTLVEWQLEAVEKMIQWLDFNLKVPTD